MAVSCPCAAHRAGALEGIGVWLVWFVWLFSIEITALLLPKVVFEQDGASSLLFFRRLVRT